MRPGFATSMNMARGLMLLAGVLSGGAFAAGFKSVSSDLSGDSLVCSALS